MMEEEKALNVGPTGIDICYERLGNMDAPPVVLIMGGAAQLIHWPDPFYRALGAGRRLHLSFLQALRHGGRHGGLDGRARNSDRAYCGRIDGRPDRADDG